MDGGDDRGVTPVLGLVLIVGFLVIALAAWQTNIVPIENAEVELDHYDRVTDDLTDFRNDLIRAGNHGIAGGTTFQIGFSYPDRTVLINPAPVSGELVTGDPQTITFENVRAVDSEAKNTRSFWQDARTYEDATRSVRYTADYNYRPESELPPITVTGQTVFSTLNNSVISIADQTLIDDNRIQLVMINGELNENGRSATVLSEPVSTSQRTVTITGNSSDPIILRLDPPAGTTAEEWSSGIGESIELENDHVTVDNSVDGQIVIELEPTRTYHLALSEVQVGERESDTDASEPAYIIAQQGDGVSTRGGQNATLVAEVRDKYNNPVRNATVTFNITSGEGTLLDVDNNEVTGSRSTETTGEGRAVQTVLVESIGEDIIVNAEVDGFDGALNSTTFRIQTPEESNPVELAGVRFDDSSRNGNLIEITFSNNANEDREMTRFRMNFYQGADPADGTIEGQSFEVEGPAITLDPTLTIPEGQTETFTIDLDINPSSGDWFVMTIGYDTGDNAQYFAGL